MIGLMVSKGIKAILDVDMARSPSITLQMYNCERY